MNKYKEVTIIGAGPAGMGVAYYCNKEGIKYRLFEKGSVVGGNCITFNINGFMFDSGAHRFHDKDKDTTVLVKDLLGSRIQQINVPSQIYINGKFVDFPLTPIGIVKFLGPSLVVKATVSLIFNKLKNTKIRNFKDLALNRYGQIISKLFLLGYSEKLWGRPAHHLSTKISGSRLKGLSFRSLMAEAFGIKKNVHLDGSFYYPEKGMGSIFSTMKERCNEENFFLKSKITSIFHNENKITSIEINKSSKVDVDLLVSSMPMNIFIRLLSPLPPKSILDAIDSISYRDLILVVFMLNKETINNNGSMYFPSKKFAFTRIYEPRNRSKFMSPKGKTSLAVEVPCEKVDKLSDQEVKSLVNTIQKQLVDIGFFEVSDIIEIRNKKIKYAYPVLESSYSSKLSPIVKYISSFENLIVNGRNGKFEYTHIHDHLNDSREIVSNLKMNGVEIENK